MFELGKKDAADKTKDARHEEYRPEAASAKPDFTPTQKRPVPGGHREAAVIGPSIHIDGDLRGEEDLLIEGEVNGAVHLKSHSLTIGSQGKIRADVYAHSVYVEGFVEGDLYGSERVSIRKTAQVRGNVTAPLVSLEEGAKFKGSIEMDRQAVEATLGGRGGSKSAPTTVAPPASSPAQQSGSGHKPGNDKLSAKPETMPGAPPAKRGSAS